MAGNVKVTVTGPLFEGVASDVMDDLLAAVTESTAKQGAAIVKSKALKMNRSKRGGTGAAAEAVTYLTTPTQAVITGTSTRGTVWWPWLEGTSTRNKSTRFKGYHAFRLATGVMKKSIQSQAEKLLPEYLAKIGGGGE